MEFRTLASNSRAYSILAILIAAILSGLALFFLIYFEQFRLYPYKLEHIDDNKHFNRKQVYVDLQNDGNAENLIFTNYSDYPVIELFDENEAFVEVIRVKGNFLDEKFSFFTGDTDHDESAEIYLLSLSNDSVILNAYELTGNDGHFIKDHFICFNASNGARNNIRLIYFGLEDTDGDKDKELLFLLRAGFSLQPRQLCTVDPWTLETKRSFESAAGYNSLFPYYDIKGKLKLVLTGTSAFENYDPDEQILFNDNSGWILAFTPDLSDTVFVREYPEDKNYLFPMIRSEQGVDYIYTLRIVLEKGKSYLEKIDLQSELLNRTFIGNGLGRYFFMNTLLPELDPIVVLYADTLHYFNDALEPVKKAGQAGELIYRYLHLDRHAFQASGFLPFLRGNKLILRDFNLNVLARYSLEDENLATTNLFSVKQNQGKDARIIAFSSDTDTIHYSVKENAFYNFRHGIYTLGYFGIFFFAYLLFYVQIFFVRRRLIRQHRITELQLQAVQNQLQPHFTFNVLNTIGSMIYKNRKEEAYDYLNRFSEMLRSTLLSRSKTNWEIREELDFINTYIEMENLRFGNRFHFELKIEKGLNMAIPVPKLIVQSYVENAVKHGLIHKIGKGTLKLSVALDKKHLRILIEDNGIGRKAAAMIERNQSGIGNSILENYMEVYNLNNKTKFIFTIEDLVDADGNAIGTRVELMIPKDMNTK